MAAATAVAGGVQAVGSLIAGQAESNSLNAQADLQIKNAAEAEAQGKFNAMKSGLSWDAKIGSMKADIGASGVSTTSGSAAAILGAAASNAEMDRLNILHGADLKAIQFENEASMERLGAKSAVLGGMFKAFGAVAGAGMKIYGMNQGGNNPGSTGSMLTSGGDNVSTGSVA